MRVKSRKPPAEYFITSHLPHLIAYTIVGTADDLGGHLNSEVLKYAAGGFRDFTRIASSDPTMWRDVFLNNKEAVQPRRLRLAHGEARVPHQRAVGEDPERFLVAHSWWRWISARRISRVRVNRSNSLSPSPQRMARCR